MTLWTTFQIGFRVMKDDLMHQFHKLECVRGIVCVGVCVSPPGQTYLINDIIPFVMRTKLFPDTCWLRVKRATQTLGNCTYSHVGCTDAVEFPVWSLKSSVPFGQMKGAMLVWCSNGPSGFLCAHIPVSLHSYNWSEVAVSCCSASCTLIKARLCCT